MVKNFSITEEKIASLSEHKTRLLEAMLTRKQVRAQVPKPQPRDADSPRIQMAASWAQQRLWFVEQLQGSSPAYNIPVTISLVGPLNVEALQRALNALLRRHEALRTVFLNVSGEPVQTILREVEFALRVTDLAKMNAAQRDAQVRLQKDEEARETFDLRTGPLIRGRLLAVRPGEHMLLITMHHIVSDAWSIGVLLRELSHLYNANAARRECTLDALPVQYADYAIWQRQWLQGVTLERQLNYWRSRLAGAPVELDLPKDRSRPAVQSHRGDTVRFAVDSKTTRALKSLARDRGVTPFMILYAGWAVLLSRLSGEDDIVIGTPVANRRTAELEGLIGFFVNSIVLRVSVAGGMPVTEFLELVKDATVTAYDHQDIPFEKIVEALQPQRSLNRHPIFQVLFSLQNTPRGELHLTDLTASLAEESSQTSKFDLALLLEERGDRIVGGLDYSTDLFDRETIERWAECYTVLIEEMLAKPEEQIGNLTLLAARERRRVLTTFNSTEAPYPNDRLLHQLFEEQVERTPDAVAVICAERALTFSQLNIRANQVAWSLRDKGVGPDQLVGLCTGRDVCMLVGMLAILKAGGAYVPLDPDYPSDRLQYMLADAAPRVLLTQASLKDRLPTTNTEVMALDGDDCGSIDRPSDNLDADSFGLQPHHLAYVIYTSGSTGKPKGVMIEHRNVASLWQGLEHIYAQTPHCRRIAVNASFNFDASVKQFVQLLSGRTIVLVPPEERLDASRLLSFLATQRIDAIDCTPWQLRAWLSAGLAEQTGLQMVLVGGEPIDADLWTKLANLDGIAFFNVYGPTESTVDTTFTRVTSTTTPHIGRPMEDRQVYVLDRYGQPLPIGVVGEMYIGGAGVARGYLKRPELTAQRFVHVHLDGDCPARLYRTGDLARWRADGAIEYVGRNDHQVKLRGFRIELGEIEAHLLRHESVEEAVVLAREDSAGEPRLVAYLVPRAHASALTDVVDQVRIYLKELLPSYMLPSAFVVLSHLPLTSNNKLDRRALPIPELNAYTTRRYEAPQGEIEELTAGVWQSLLRVDRVGRHDNFFELGGHSLLIMQMLERLRRVGLSIEVRRVFEIPTLAELARALTDSAIVSFAVPPNLIAPGAAVLTPQMLPLVQLDAQQLQHVVDMIPGGAANIEDIYPLAPLQEGILFHHLLDHTGGDIYVVPIVLLVSSRERLDQLIAALQAVIDHHEVLRTAVLWEQLPRPVQVVCRQAALRVEEESLNPQDDPLRQIRERWLAPAQQRLDIRRAPLMKLKVAADPRSGEWYVLLQTHHITSDHITLDIVISDVVKLMRGASLPRPSVKYRNHIAQTLAYARTNDVEAFFRSKLADIEEPTAPFGLSDVRGAGTDIVDAHEELPSALAARVRTNARRVGVSAATLFHAAWGLVVAHTSGRDDIVFGSVLLGRLQGTEDTRRTLGMFINTLPLRLSLSGLTARDLVERTQRELIELLTHEQASLAVAQRCSGIGGAAPLFSALLNYRHSAPDPNADWNAAHGVRLLIAQESTNYPISASVDDLGEGFALKIQTDRRVDPHRMLQYLHVATDSLVDALEAAPRTPALALCVLPQSERAQLLNSFNDTYAPYPLEKLVHQLFEEQAARTPEAVAVVCGDQQLSYAQLERQANQLAHFLMDRGVGPDSFVGLCVERGVHMVLGIIGILKAGGAYVPLDPAYPQPRLEYILADTRPRVVLTQERFEARIPPGASVTTLDAQWNEIAGCTRGESPPRAAGTTSADLAYVIYTSGSTGRPKGVAIEHRNAVNFVCWGRSASESTFFERTLHSTSLNFDLSIYECFVPLSVGGTVVIVENALALLHEWRDVTLINTVPSAIKGLLDAGRLPNSLRAVNLAGEALKQEVVERIFENSSVEEVRNLYGPTETTTYSTGISMTRQTGFLHTIGRPIANTQIYVLDRNRNLAPLGVVGEIYIGGAGVAREYLNRPELTAERFLADPFSPNPSGRMYRTGDLGLWRENGTIEYLGRNDHQIKIRGFRVELGEIEAQLGRHASVGEAVVIAREDIPGEKRLVAYVVPVAEAAGSLAPAVEELKSHLKAQLPEHMVPSAIVLLDRLPLTSNGKLDRRALPAPEVGAYASRRHEPPQGEFEEILASIWTAVLGVEQIGRHDNFFELGGHSLLIVQMMERLRGAGLAVDLRRAFDSPTLAELAAVLTSEVLGRVAVPPNLIALGSKQITPQMLPLIDLEQRHIEQIADRVPGGVDNIQDIYPLAPSQEGILFHHLMRAELGDTYVMPMVLLVSSRRRLEDLAAAWQAAIDRHDVLRTAVLWEGLPRPVQVVQRNAMLSMEEVELDPSREAAEQMVDWLRPERQQLDLRHAPLIVLQVAEDRRTGQWYALLRIHHIICDHVSLESVSAEVIAQLQGTALRHSRPIPYRDHVAQALAYARMNDVEAFFRSKLADIDEPTAPFGLLDVHGDGVNIREHRQEIEPDLARRVRFEASRMGVSAATLFHAAWSLVVAHISGRSDVVFGSVLLGRLRSGAGAQHALGMFINTLPLRIRLANVTAKTLVQRTQRELIDLLANEQASLAVAQRCSAIAGGLPLFTTLLNYRHTSAGSASSWSGVTDIWPLAGQERTNYPIALAVDDFGEGFRLKVQTDVRIDACYLAASMHAALNSLVDALGAAPQTVALTLMILPGRERCQLLNWSNAASVAYPEEQLVHGSFEEQVKRTPTALAVVYGERSLTYSQLNVAANQLARYLRSHGVEHEDLVGVCMDRGVDTIVALLAVLKTGAAYVPLDPDSPPQRLAYMIENSRLSVLLTQSQFAHDLGMPALRRIAIEERRREIEENDGSDLGWSGMTPDQLAYVIYTSGSTGQPKGVMIEHRHVLNLWMGLQEVYPSGGCAKIAVNAAFTFDASIQQLSQLLSGRTLFVVPSEVRRDAERLLTFIDRYGIEAIDCTPSQLRTWAACGLLERGRHPLRTVLVGGEAIEQGLWNDLASSVIEFYNVYGPTECTVDATIAKVKDDGSPAHIGRPMPNRRVYVLNGAGMPVPVGVAGEIYIGGAGVGRGYLGRPDLTAQRFVPDPFSSVPGARLYRTGDVGSWRADGVIEYIGRNDDQVKIRGYRIELGEIQAQLTAHPSINEAAVLVREDAPGEKRLVAYYVPRYLQTAPSAEELRQSLRRILPEHMIPSAFVQLDRFPLTASGKLDARALPLPELGAYATRHYESAHGEVERALTTIWQMLLHVERVGRNDNFFELGGHSLLGIKLVTAIEERLAVRAPVTAIFKYPTLAELAEFVGALLLAAGPRSVAELQGVEFTDEARFDVYDEGVLDENSDGTLLCSQEASWNRRGSSGERT